MKEPPLLPFPLATSQARDLTSPVLLTPWCLCILFLATEPKVNQEVDSDGEEMAEEKERDAEEGVEDVEEDVEEEADEVEEVEEDGDGGSEYETENDTETTGTETDEDYGDKSNR